MKDEAGSRFNRSHGQRNEMRETIRREILSYPEWMEFWKIKYQLATKILAKYNLPPEDIGQVNHMIE